jgi:hypothetical protein
MDTEACGLILVLEIVANIVKLPELLRKRG